MGEQEIATRSGTFATMANMADEDDKMPRIDWDATFIANRRLARRQWGWKLAFVLAVGAYGLWMEYWGVVAVAIGGVLLCIRQYVTHVQLARTIASEECFDSEKVQQLSRERMPQDQGAR
jgi:hypothetical protein